MAMALLLFKISPFSKKYVIPNKFLPKVVEQIKLCTRQDLKSY